MLDKLLKELVNSVAGSGADKIVDVLFNKNNVNEFAIAKKLNSTINQARNILYKLADEGIVLFNRKKDSKSGGWYTYFWTLDVDKSLTNFRNKLIKEIEALESQIASRQTKQFYVCVYCGMEVSEENALLYDFTCPECGEVFQLKDNSADVEQAMKSIEKLKEKLAFVDEEINNLKKKDTASKARHAKKEAENKKKEREEKMKIKAKAKLKEAKSLAKKKSSKKSGDKAFKKKSVKKSAGKKLKKKTPAKKKTAKKSSAKKIIRKIFRK